MAGAVAPAFEPAGFGQWQASGVLVTGFVAKEAVISSWGQTYALQDESAGDESAGDESAADASQASDEAALGEAIRSDFEVSSGGHTNAAILAFMAFLLAYTPCVATLAAQKREIGLRWAVFGVGVQLVVAWSLAVLVFQVGKLFG